ncbi:hypothetical protein F511_25472 [Dorcoceras hygrometricum]|uniref:Uncharacterized protein n=1 Tax=Dorcoceras hygrometricum TaxID=472368 RepID=A0A2Z7AYU9_9LAMI|nr:hypothetical protein F511_25472 [Dorcoceras hygrometricum]
MKVRNKGKVHPFNSSSSSSSLHSPKQDEFPVLRLLPAAIFTLVSILSVDDREVLAYMITRSLKSTNNPSFIHDEEKKKSSKKPSFGTSYGHKSPALFDCECFYCYTSFWFRWDSSPNRELIQQAIEEFEEHLNNGELSILNGGNGKNRRKEKMGRRKIERICGGGGGGTLENPAVSLLPENQESLVLDPPASEVPAEVEDVGGGVDEAQVGDAAAPVAAVHSHKGLARKVLPDVMGIFNSRLWSLWSPNV